MIAGLTVVRKPFETYLIVRENDGDRELRAAECDHIVAAVSLMDMIDGLRADEGDSVTILCDNPEGPPNNAVECNGHWTNWEDKRFEGETLSEALSAAWLECIQIRAAIAAGKKWSND